jgi:hypothetical protein
VGICAACGNDYAGTFEVRPDEMSVFVFDSFECAIQLLAPTCAHCGIRVIGHGVEADGIIFCCAHCARSVGSPGPVDRVETPPAMQRGDRSSNDLDDLDAALADSFPASDPPSATRDGSDA